MSLDNVHLVEGTKFYCVSQMCDKGDKEIFYLI